MKLTALFLAMILVNSCLAETRRVTLGGMYGQQQRLRGRNGKVIEGDHKEKGNVMYPDQSNIKNHHGIHRQYYNDQDGNSQRNNGHYNNAGKS
ncbi:hypothetical protein O6P43_006652 [Quillaja saponaria]|uniref:Uncharacterized protein n=1 Tax=Quillaja saponaria TaxID=32244 RepID=A0AAD7VIA7_QUISA|nr:hypothetical protein O6P43_006652 [Quillaja saponaria]